MTRDETVTLIPEINTRPELEVDEKYQILLRQNGPNRETQAPKIPFKSKTVKVLRKTDATVATKITEDRVYKHLEENRLLAEELNIWIGRLEIMLDEGTIDIKYIPERCA